VHLWQGVALPTLLFLAGLQTIPTELYEAASIDGANAWHQFKSITFAYLLPTLSVVLVLVVKQGLMVFDYVKAMTEGGPGGATQSIALLIYTNGFERNKYSYSIAQAIMTGILIAMISVFQIKLTSKKKVE
ncbi:MAG: sugar ABC transporter permease, partial [Clostridia bacterium]